jgi:GNAT superfamily N-acetyltransferase
MGPIDRRAKFPEVSVFETLILKSLPWPLRQHVNTLIHDVWSAESNEHRDVTLLVPKGITALDPLEDSSTHILIVDDKGRLVGYGRVTIITGDKIPEELSGDTSLGNLDKAAYISRLVVHPMFRSKGISKLIHALRLDMAAKYGASEVIGWAVGPLAERNLSTLGFKPIKSKSGFRCPWYKTSRTATLMRLDLQRGLKNWNICEKVAN